MSSHPTDASGTRDVDLEGKNIKMLLTSKTDSEKTPSSGINIKFPSLALSAIPNFAASKILANRIVVKYVPDFYYVMDRLQHLFVLAKHDSNVKRIETLNIYSFSLYVAYSLMYAYLETVQDVNGAPSEVADVLNIMRSVGFNSNKLPSVTSQWLDALGKYVDPDTKRTFVPYLPEIATTGGYFNNYFFSEDTGHLLPNFRAMFAIISMFADPPSVNLPPNNRTRNVRLGGDFPANPELRGTTEARRYVYRIPGLERLATTVGDSQLPALLMPTLTKQNWSSNLHRYLMLDVNVLRYLKEAVSPLFNEIETVVYSNASPVGNGMIMIPLISDKSRRVIHDPIDIPTVAAAGNVAGIPHVIIHSGFDNASRVKTRVEVINGYIDYVYQTPLVRIIEDEESVKLDDHIHVNPQDIWYTVEHEFQTPVVTLLESQAYFHKM